jgi:CRP-like cAMP-binding protein
VSPPFGGCVSRAGQVVVRAGSVDTRLYLVVQGEAVGVDPLTMRARGSVMRMGQFFGEESVLSGAPYEHSIMAASALGCFYLDKQYIETHMGQLEVRA